MIRVGRRADTLEDAATELQEVITVVEATSQPMSRRDPVRPFMDIIYKYAQDKSPFTPAMVPRVSAPFTRVCYWIPRMSGISAALAVPSRLVEVLRLLMLELMRS